MKTILSAFLLCISFTAFSQEIFIDNNSQDTCLFLGGIDINSKELKVIQNGNIQFKKPEHLTQVGLIYGTEFTEQVFSKGLCFILDGYEPFWTVKIVKDKLIEGLADIEKKEYAIRFYSNDNDMTSTYFAMFLSDDGSIFGTIRYLGLTNIQEQHFCDYDLSDEASLYEAFICMQGVIYKGCVTIKKDME